MLYTETAPTSHGNISLVLSYAPLGLVRALHAEIGTEKMLVDTGCVTLANDSEVDILLSIHTDDQPNHHRIRARVAGIRQDGVVLAFQECDVATLEALLPYITIH